MTSRGPTFPWAQGNALQLGTPQASTHPPNSSAASNFFDVMRFHDYSFHTARYFHTILLQTISAIRGYCNRQRGYIGHMVIEYPRE
jgi:hypothetical protein